MKTLEKKIEVMQVALAGKEIQVSDMEEWYPVDNPVWNWDDYDYRVKPENKQIPYDFSDAENLIGRKLKSKIDGFFHLITLVDNDSVLLSGTKWVRFIDLDSVYEIWNKTLNRWESCTKTVKG